MTDESQNVRTMRRWLADGTSWIGVFRNEDLGHPQVGCTCAFVFDDKDWETAVVGQTHAPDGKSIGLGWRYILIGKFRNVEDADRALRQEDFKKAIGEKP